MICTRFLLPLVLAVVTVDVPRARAQADSTARSVVGAGSSDAAVLARIRSEGLERSQVVETATQLSDVRGPRLAGSPGYRKAAEWARQTLDSYGLRNASLEPWGKRRGRSWVVDRHSVELVKPYYERIVAYPKAWSPPTAGVVRGIPKLIAIRSDSDLVRHRAELKGAIVLNGTVARDTSLPKPFVRRFTDAELDSMSRITDPGSPRTYWEDADGYMERVERRRLLSVQLKAAGVAAVLEPSRNANAVGISGYQAYDSDVTKAVPSFVVSSADYARIANLVERNQAPVLELVLRSRYLPGDSLGFNIVAELPGSDPDLAAEVVMVGGHFDSWTAGTGATDNAAGCAVAMEVMRILTVIGARPKRTIRAVLWDGEEHEDYYGSMGYVRKHFGDPETMVVKPAQATVSAYFNIDNGTGRIRGIYTQGNAAVRPILAGMLEPLRDLGASTLTIANVGSTDHMPISAIGIPAFTFIQDPLDYETRTHHTNLDVALNLAGEDLKQAAVVAASVVYQTANRSERLPTLPLPLVRRK